MPKFDKHGWDKAARLREKRKEQQQENQPPQLEPKFPWRMIPFDPQFFGIPADPRPKRGD